jgi:hypothetical protein
MRLASELGMADASYDESTRRGGRPGLPPIELLPPEFVPMTTSQHEIAIRTLAVLLDSWLKGERTVRTGKLPANRRSNLETSSDGQMTSDKPDE